MENGWIKIHRKLLKKGYYKKSQFIHLWVHLLMLATHEETEFFWNGKVEKLQKGQFVTGRKSLSEDTGIPKSTIEDILRIFEQEGQIRQQKNTKFRLLTIINWKEHQDIRQPADNQPTTSRHIQEHKKIKNKDINILSQSDEVFSFKEQMSKMKTDPDKRMLTIGYYWYYKGWTFDNKKQYSAALKRELRPATDLSGFKIQDISKAMDYCSKEYKVWSLETVFKRITDLMSHDIQT